MLSFGENLLRKYLKRCFPKEEVLYNYRNAGIYNTTGNQLELDIYFPALKIAFEFNGRQHKTDKEQVARDKIKKQSCKKLGILLITVWAKDLDKDFYSEIKEKVFNHSGYKITKPNSNFLTTFKNASDDYKVNVKKLNRRIKSDKFVKVKK